MRSPFKAANTIIWMSILVALSAPVHALGQTETIEVDLRLCSGGGISGLVVDHNPDGIVIMRDTTPYVFAWSEVETGSAYAARLDLLELERGGAERLTAEDHYLLGVFALAGGRRDLAGREFGRARRLDDSYKVLARQAFDRHRREETESKSDGDASRVEIPAPSGEVAEEPGLVNRVQVEFGSADSVKGVPRPSPEIRAKVMEIYRSFGRTVQQAIYEDLVLIETDHFLIWTDWKPRNRGRLGEWCEGMYTALCAQFGLDPADGVFLAKCPVFCWRSKARFRKFAQQFDGYPGTNAVGYTRSVEKNGHVHIVLLLQGRSEADYDRFACTLVHEGTHAVVHRVHSAGLIPHWVNEGYADLIAERVLEDRCPNAEKAALLARQYIRYDWSIGHLLSDSGPIGVHEYPLAYSVVAYLEALDPGRFAAFVRGLKAGDTIGTALATNYDDMTIQELEAGWRTAIRAGDPGCSP